MEPTNNSIILSSATVSLTEENILVTKIAENAEIDVPQIDEMRDAALQLTKGKKYAQLVDSRLYSTATREAMHHSASINASLNIVARAILTPTLPGKIMGNFYMKFVKPIIPTQLFNNEKDAINWLKKQLKESDSQQSSNSKKLHCI